LSPWAARDGAARARIKAVVGVEGFMVEVRDGDMEGL
jgi:hypothetical protein